MDAAQLQSLGGQIEGKDDAGILAVADATPGGLEGLLDELNAMMVASFDAAKAEGERGVIRYDITLPTGVRPYELHVADGVCTTAQADDAAADVVIGLSAADYIRMHCGQLNVMKAFIKRKMKLKGDVALARKTGTWFGA